MKFQTVIEIQAPITEVFEFVADMRYSPKRSHLKIARLLVQEKLGKRLWLVDRGEEHQKLQTFRLGLGFHNSPNSVA